MKKDVVKKTKSIKKKTWSHGAAEISLKIRESGALDIKVEGDKHVVMYSIYLAMKDSEHIADIVTKAVVAFNTLEVAKSMLDKKPSKKKR